MAFNPLLKSIHAAILQKDLYDFNIIIGEWGDSGIKSFALDYLHEKKY